MKIFILKVILLVIMIAPFSGCADDEAKTIQTINGIHLTNYTDDKNYFSLHIPEDWTVSVQDYILAMDDSDNGTANVRIQPIHLSGKYRDISAREIANYLVGKEKGKYDDFQLESVRESTDGKFSELAFLFSENITRKKCVCTIFVNTPYAMLSSYETIEAEFDEKEVLLSTIASSYRQFTPGETSDHPEAGRDFSKSSIGKLLEKDLDGGVKMLLPEGWNVQVFPGCSGLIAVDNSNHARTVVFMNGLHQSVEPLPPGVTPEYYITDIMPRDFQTVSEVHIIKYEDADLSALTARGNINVKAMRIAFKNEGIPTEGSFTVGTYQTGISTAIAYLWGISSPSGEFEIDAPALISIFNSIDYSQSALGKCKEELDASWKSAHRVSETLSRTGEEIRQEQMLLWEQRQEKNDEFIEKFSDSILDRDRVYNPKYDEVYEVSDTFYDYYDKHREEFEYSDMRQLEPGEWLKHAPLNGELHIR